MEALLRDRPPPDRYQARDTSTAAIATGRVVKYREKKAKKDKKAKKAEKSSAPLSVETPKKVVVPVKQATIQTPVVVPSTASAFEVKGEDSKHKSKKNKLSTDQKPSTAMASASNSSSSSKRKREGKEPLSKSKKRSHRHEVKSRGRSKSRGPSSRSSGKRGRSPSLSSESESQISESVISSDESESTDSEEEERRRRRMRGRSRSRSRRPRAQSRGRSRSRARSSSYDSDSESSRGEEEEAKIFMAFTVPGGKTHMRPVTSTTSFDNLKEKIYAMSNINQKIPLELTYVVNGITLQLSDEEDLKSLLELSPINEMIHVLVQKVEPHNSKPIPKPKTPAKVVATADPSNSVTPAVALVPTAPVVTPVTPTPVSKAESSKKGKKEKKQKKKEQEIAQLAKVEADGNSSEDIPLSKMIINGKTSVESAKVGGDSTITVEKQDGSPLARIVLKEDDKSTTKEKVKKDTPAPAAKPATEEQGSPVKKEKRKRRNPEEMAEFRREKEAKKLQQEKEKEEKKAAKRAARRAEKAALETAEQAKAAGSVATEKPAEEAVAPSKTAPAAALLTTVKPVEETVGPAGKPSKDAAPKKKKVKKNATTDDSQSKAPVKGAEKALITSPKKTLPVSKSTVADVKQSEPVTQSAEKTEKETALKDSTVQAKKIDCTVCFSKEHDKLHCPIIIGGKTPVEKRYHELKEKKRTKTKLENEACKILEEWLKTNKEREEEELRFSQNGTLRYRRNPLEAQAKHTSEAERLEDEEDQREMTIAMEQERKRLQAERNQKVAASSSSSSSSPTKGRHNIDDIIGKVNKDKARLGLPISPRKAAPNSNRVKSSSVEIDQLEDSQDANMEDASEAAGISPSFSESELATSPMLMAKAENRSKANGDVKKVDLPAAVDSTLTKAKSAAKSSHSSDTDTSDDSDSDDDRVSGSVDKEDDIQENSEESPQGEETESVSQSSSSDDTNDQKQSNEDDEEEEVDEIEATPIQGKQQTPKSSWVSGISNILRFGSSSQDESVVAAIADTPVQAPTSAQRPRQMESTPKLIMTPSSQRPRMGGATRLSQLDTSTLKTSFSQPGTPLNNTTITPFASQASKRKAVEEPTHFDSGSESDDSNSDESDSDQGTKKSQVPASKLAGRQSKKPRSSLLAKFAN